MPTYNYNPEEFTFSIDGKVVYQAQECANILTKALLPEQLEYAGMPARGQYRGFGALHDLLDANCLLPGVDTLPLIEHPTEEHAIAFFDAVIAFANDSISEVTDGRKPSNYITIEAKKAWSDLEDDRREDPHGVESYQNSYGDKVECMEEEREDYEHGNSYDFTSDVISDDHFAWFVNHLREEGLLLEDKPEPVQPATVARRVWWFTIDTDAGTDTTLFGSEAEFHAALAKLMTEDMDKWSGDCSAEEEARVNACRSLITEGKAWDAWVIYHALNGDDSKQLHASDSYFSWGEQEVVFPASAQVSDDEERAAYLSGE